jgi:hypothetical protein
VLELEWLNKKFSNGITNSGCTIVNDPISISLEAKGYITINRRMVLESIPEQHPIYLTESGEQYLKENN